MHKVEALLWGVDLPLYFDDPHHLELLKDILTIHDWYSGHLIATATGCALSEAHIVLNELAKMERVSVVYEIRDKRRRNAPVVAYIKSPPAFPMHYVSPLSSKRIKLPQEHAAIALNYQLSGKYKGF